MNSKLRIGGAVIIGVLLIGGSFIVSPGTGAAVPDPRVEAVVAPAPPRNFIDVDDTDGDGIADWKQTLPSFPSMQPSATSSTEVDTHTETLAVQTLQRLMQSNISGGFGEDLGSITGDTQRYIAELATDTFFTEADITISSDTTNAALRSYGNAIARIVRDNALEGSTEGEIVIVGKALRDGTPETLAALAPIIASYDGMIEDMQHIGVPRTLTEEHLDLLNAYNALRIDIDGMRQAFTDPVYALARFQRYQDDAEGLYYAIVNLYTKLHEDGVRWSKGDIASEFIRIDE